MRFSTDQCMLTGKPKGVLINQRSAANLVRNHSVPMLAGLPREALVGLRALQFYKVGFDGAAWDTLCALGNGMSLVLWNGVDLAEELRARRVEVAEGSMPHCVSVTSVLLL